MNLFGRTKREFEIEPISYPETDRVINRCAGIYAGVPDWLDAEDEIITVNFAKSVCAEIARLATLDIAVTVDGSSRAEWIQGEIDKLFRTIRDKLEHGCAYGTIIIKPSDAEATLEVFFPGDYVVTDYTNGKIDGAVFRNVQYNAREKTYYTRLEWHRFENGRYIITNRCFKGSTAEADGTAISIEESPWAGLAEEVEAENVDEPLFAVLKMPNANNINPRSPFALPVFADAIEELKALDIAFSRNNAEIDDSRRTVLLDTDVLLTGKSGKEATTVQGVRSLAQALKLPKIVRMVRGNGEEMLYREINPTLNTEERLKGINALLSQIGFKCGFSNGYFVFNEKSGMITATQVEADDRRTIQLVNDVRGSLKNCIDQLCYALNKFADAYDLAPVGAYDVTYDFADITHNVEEDRARIWNQVVAGMFPYKRYLMLYEGYSEKEADEIVTEIGNTPTLFDE